MRADRKGKNEAKAIAGDPAMTRLFVRTLKLTDFRNYARAELKLDGRPVVLIGDNGSGKTNLLEAVSLLDAGPWPARRPYGELCRKDGRRRLRRRGAVWCRARTRSRSAPAFPPARARKTKGRTVRIAGKDASAGALGEYVRSSG